MQAVNRSPEEIEEIKEEIRRWYNRGLLKDTFSEIMSNACKNQSDSITEALQYTAEHVGERYQLSRDEFMALMTEAIRDTNQVEELKK